MHPTFILLVLVMSVNTFLNIDNPSHELSNILERLHKEGPSNPEILEKICYLKLFYFDEFNKFEERILAAIGVYYKIEKPKNLYTFLMMGFANQHVKDFGEKLTPVQASIRRALEDFQFTSISAPTSAGKSFSVRDFILRNCGDSVIVVPSRALIAEYIDTMKKLFNGDKKIMISPFIDTVFQARNPRRIFILTPERTKDIFKLRDKLNIDLFFFDEAQITDEPKRGITFDSMIRKVQKYFPDAKLIFAHPFVDNPEAHFKKHNIDNSKCFSKSYTHGTVGKICVFKHDNCKFYYFSPYRDQSHLLRNCLQFVGNFKDFALSGEHTVLVYTSKRSIYNGNFISDFDKYIENFSVIEDERANEIIEKICQIVGANDNEHKSNMVSLLKKGVVIHHGSIPLEVRFLIEDFIREGFSNICFATSTLAQGINMPFDIVWLENNRFIGSDEEKSLAFKNLIGRSGRLTNDQKFDYGYVYTNNPILFSSRINSKFRLKEKSIIEEPIDPYDDNFEFIDAIQNDSFDEDKNMPLSMISRMSQDPLLEYAKLFLNIIYSEDTISQSIGGSQNKENRKDANALLKEIYCTSLDRELNDAEHAVFNQAITIFFHIIQGRTFREIVGIRYNYISKRDFGYTGYANYSQPAEKLPNFSLNKYSLFKWETLASNVNYDTIVYDTYDYMDQVLSFSLSDVFIGSFQVYYEYKKDDRALKIIELFKYGTNNQINILLMRYGFPSEIANELSQYIESIDEINLKFNSSIQQAPEYIKKLVEWYLP